ncbi:phage tail protein I [Klebsiella oxytoca]|nr:phage tail protein I [Klebsiella oxytoca]
MIELSSTPFVDLLPDSIKNDNQIKAAASALDAELTGITNTIGKLTIWDRMDDHTEPLLTTLAWQLSMINEPAWGQAEDDDTKRQLLKGAIELHRHKGTPWAVREVMRILGYGEIGLIEGIGGLFYDGTGKHDGVYVYGQENAWAIYTVILSRQISVEEERALRAVLALIAPARDWLDQFIVED